MSDQEVLLNIQSLKNKKKYLESISIADKDDNLIKEIDDINNEIINLKNNINGNISTSEFDNISINKNNIILG